VFGDSGLWKDIFSIGRDNKASRERRFLYYVTKKTGNSSDTIFWHQTWLDGIALKDCFTRLFNGEC